MNYVQRDDWIDLCRENLDLAAGALCELAREERWPSARWNSALQVWSEDKFLGKSWSRLSSYLVQAPEEFLREISQNTARWVRGTAGVVHESDAVFLKLCEQLLRLDYPASIPDGDPLTQAINHPIGDATEALLQWWFRTGLEDSQGLHPKLNPVLSELCNTKITQYRHARVWLAARAITLFRVDPGWTTKNLVPLFDWGSCPSEAIGIWSGFLQSARFYLPFIDKIKAPFIRTVDHYEDIGDRGSVYAGLLLFAALDETSTFRRKDLRDATKKLPDDGLQHTARLLAQLVDGENDQGKYWKTRVKPYLRSIWPQLDVPRAELVHMYLAELCIAAGELFPDAVKTLKYWLNPLREHAGYVVNLLHDAGHCKKSPKLALELLHRVVDTNYQWAPTKLGDCLEEITDAKEVLRNDPRYLQLVEFRRGKRGS